jgi:hydrogenase-1 operon protein HyaE
MQAAPDSSPDISRLLTLFARLVAQHGFEAPGVSRIAEFARSKGTVVLFFAGDPRRVPESWDVAVVLPDLLAAVRDGMRVALLDPALSQSLAAQYEVTILPTLVFMRDGQRLGAIERMRDWEDFEQRIAKILSRSAEEPAGDPVLH